MSMDFQTITINAEDILYAGLVAESKGLCESDGFPPPQYMQCHFFHLAEKPEEENIRALVKEIPGSGLCTAYLCKDGDVFFRYSGESPNVLEILADLVAKAYGDEISKVMPLHEFFTVYDVMDTQSRLKAECSRKLKKQTKQSMELAKFLTNDVLIQALNRTIQLTKMQRALRKDPHILIVEDQIFSQKLLTAILKDYTCTVADDVASALLLYMEKCPDIVFLDIELPRLSGHSFAKFLNEIDKDAYVVMVSGNQYSDDVKTAKENNVKGFIGKPYKKEAILDAVQKFKTFRSKKSS